MLCNYPPMGWNSWDCYGTSVTEEIVRQNAEFMAEHLKFCGWEYVVVDIQWYHSDAVDYDYRPFSDPVMDAWGRLMPAVNRFPSAADGAGFKPLADYIHSLGLKFGIHIMRGVPRMAAHLHLTIEGSSHTCDQAANPNSICQWNPDMYGARQDHDAGQEYYDSIFRLYAEWGVDFVKCDDIAREYPHCRREIEMISAACRKCGRSIVLSLSPGPGHWPDAAMLPFGAIRQCGGETPLGRWTNFSEDEQRTLMTLWCMMRSPLMMGGEMTKCDPFTVSLLTNVNVLAIQRQSYCAHALRTTDKEAVWIAPGKDGQGVYVAVFNLSDADLRVTVSPQEIERSIVSARELWTGESASELAADLRPHACAVWLVECK